MSLSNKKLIIILATTIPVLAITTTILILLTKPAPTQDQPDQPDDTVTTIVDGEPIEVPDESHLSVQLTDFFTPNALEYDDDTHQITGLKNKEIEQQINSAISKLSAYQIDLPGIVSLYNFPTFAEHPADSTLNLRLDTGEPFSFNDVFIAGTNIAALVGQAYYEALHCEQYGCSLEEPLGALNEDIEGLILSTINIYNTDNDIPFFVSYNSVNFQINGRYCHIRFAEHPASIAIYKRFSPDPALFESAPKILPRFVFTSDTPNISYDFIDDNIFVYATANETYYDVRSAKNIPIPQKAYDKLKDTITNANDQLISDLKKNTTKSYVIYAYMGIDTLSGSEPPLFEANDAKQIQILEFEKSAFPTKQNFMEFIASVLRRPKYDPSFQYYNETPPYKSITPPDQYVSSFQIYDQNGTPSPDYCPASNIWEADYLPKSTLPTTIESDNHHYTIDESCKITQID